MTTKPRRHIMIEMKCENCGVMFLSPQTRVKKGQGKFCSLPCWRTYIKEHPAEKEAMGKKNGKKAFDKIKNAWYVYWIDPETNKRKTTTYARWWWEINKGEVPDGYRASYKDGNPLNIDPENIVLHSPEEYGNAISTRLMGHGFDDETLRKMSDAKRGKPLSDEHKKNIGSATKQMWERGVFDDPKIRRIYSEHGKTNKGYKHTEEAKRKMSKSGLKRYENPQKYERMMETRLRGENHPNWRGGISKEIYPPEFSKRLREQIRRRDGYRCRICKNDAKSFAGKVHHIDANKNDNELSNLILLCNECHGKIHATYKTDDPVILAFRSMLK